MLNNEPIIKKCYNILIIINYAYFFKKSYHTIHPKSNNTNQHAKILDST